MNKEIFSYLVLVCPVSAAVQFDWSDWSCLDILAAFIDAEDQAETPIDLWAFDWEENMDRVAPVQSTLGWDPRPYLIAAFRECSIKPLYECSGYKNDDDKKIIYFEEVPCGDQLINALQLASLPVGSVEISGDKTRFNEVICCSADISRAEKKGLLFIGCWDAGQPYKDDFLGDVKEVLVAAGMKFFTRHENIIGDLEESNIEIRHEIEKKCIDNLKKISLFTLMCAQDNDDLFPNCKRWYEEIDAYYASKNDIFSCPAVNLPYAYAMNSNLSGANRLSVKDPHHTVLFYESDSDVINDHGLGESAPQLERHIGGNAYAFADGHIEVFSKGEKRSTTIKWTVW